MAGEQSQIQGVPPGVTLEPVQSDNASGISGVPAGVTLEAVPAQSQIGPPNQPEGMAGRFGAYSQLGEGVLKGGKETAQGVASAINWTSDKVTDALGMQREKPWQPFQNQDLEGKTPLES